ncbi:hypothetical protein ABDD95_19240 [Mucilaginibacter sp. PAMB04274]|uniref:hypothetical protein n=1 Tax=Mucilaginibacter sp. PAMB04274 TaxID=3138568 RepID=UPI0031F65A9E
MSRNPKNIENSVRKVNAGKGFRATDIYPEVESYDDLKYDYLVKYEIYGPVMVELKLLHNDEIQNTNYRNAYKVKLEKYLKLITGMGSMPSSKLTTSPLIKQAIRVW